MSETDCLQCGCTTHRNKKCANCGCTSWTRADFQTAKAVTANNQILGLIADQLINVVDILVEQFPDAAERVRAARRERAEKEQAEALKEKEQHGDTDPPTNDPPTIYDRGDDTGV